MKDEEYLRLPHGMFDRDEEWIKRERIILENHLKIGERIGCKLKKYSPLSYSSTFIRGAKTAENKVYNLNSKSGKSLVLSSDSTPSVFRNYVTSSNGEAQRISFVAPLFRYRNSHSRHFTQIGYSIVNERKSENDILDIYLIQLAKAMTDLFKSCGIKTKIHINDYSALKILLSKYISEDELPDILHELQFASLQERINIFEKYITDEKKCNQVKRMFQSKPMKFPLVDDKNDEMDLPEEYDGIYSMAEALNYITNVDIFFDFQDLHSIETIDNYALRFRTVDGIALGDGGEYTRYACRWNKKIRSFWSVASGVEAIERNSPEMSFYNLQRRVALYNIDATPNFILKVIKKIEDMGEYVTYKGLTKNVSKAVRKIKKDYTHIAIIGSREESGEDIIVRSINDTNSIIIESPNRIILKADSTKKLEEER